MSIIMEKFLKKVVIDKFNNNITSLKNVLTRNRALVENMNILFYSKLSLSWMIAH